MTISNRYYGLGDRLQQTVGMTTTTYTLDLAAGLTQVLADGTNSYLYGVARIGEQQPGGWRYHHGDGLGSVRQVTDAAGEVLLAQDYQPYGEVLYSLGNTATSYGFTGEWTDGYIGLVNLRSRMYSPGTGRFFTKDSWEGDYLRPITYNGWQYAYGNPVNRTDPTGQDPISTCIGLFVTFATIDGPIPIGDAAGLISCGIILAAAGVSVSTVVQQADEFGVAVETVVDQCEWTWEKLLQQPSSEPQRVPIAPPLPQQTSTPEPKHIFYFSELGSYNPGRSIIQIRNDLESIRYIPGIPGMINQLESAPVYPLIMGRKFEAERAIYYYNQQKLQSVNSTSHLYDLMVSNMATIKYIEIKWSGGAIDKSTLTKVIGQARLHPSRTFLFETTWISLPDQKYLIDEGGRQYP